MTFQSKRQLSVFRKFPVWRVTEQFWRSLLCILPVVICLLVYERAPGQTPVRLAVLDFTGEDNREFSAELRKLAIRSSTQFDLLDDDLVQAAATGNGYSGSLNLSREEARLLGQSIGCDYYVLGKVVISRRAIDNEHFYYESLAGLFFVETRTGELALFSYESAKAQTEQSSRSQLKTRLQDKWPGYTSVLIDSSNRHLSEIENLAPKLPPVEVLTDDMVAQGVEQPFFYQRIKPDYTEQADLAGITATVELEAVFRADGTVGDVEVIRWAGFGLDESAISTVKKLRFKAAEQNGKKLTLKGLVRYNFRRPLSQAERKDEIDRLKRSLRDINKVPTKIPGQRPKL